MVFIGQSYGAPMEWNEKPMADYVEKKLMKCCIYTDVDVSFDRKKQKTHLLH